MNKKEYDRKYYTKNRAKILEYKKQRANKLRDKGLCVECGKRYVDYFVSSVFCPICLCKTRVSINKRKQRLLMEGLCIKCGKNYSFNGYFCFDCYNRQKDASCLLDVSGDLDAASVFVEGLDD